MKSSTYVLFECGQLMQSKLKCSKFPIIVLVHNEILTQKSPPPPPPEKNFFFIITSSTAALSIRKLTCNVPWHLQPFAVKKALYFTYQFQFITSDTHTTFISVSATEKLKH